MKTLLQKIANLPVGAIATMVGLATLSNMYASLGYSGIKHITMFVGILVWAAAFLKLTVHFQTFKKEYANVVPASLYATFTMLTMILGSYIFTYSPAIGKGIWLTGVVLHFIHILIFTYRNVIKGVNKDTFVPTWFVTYNGFLVSAVVGTGMNMPGLLKIIAIYGIIVFLMIIPFMIVRMIRRPLPAPLTQTAAILLAPSSLCLVAYLNAFATPNAIVVYGLYAAIFATLIFILINIPKFFKFEFHPGFAALTFPLAIGVVASTKMAGYLTAQGFEAFGLFVKEVSGIQLYATTIIIGFVAYNFVRLLVHSYQKQN
ncbi:MAG: TDT family transporter [Turicibacter sp.]